MILAMPAMALADTWSYYVTCTVTDNGSTDRTNLPILTGINGQSLIDSHYLDSSGNITNMLEGTSAASYGVATTNVTLFIPSLLANQTRTYKFYMNYVTSVAHKIIVGYNGYFTTAYNAALELSGNFTSEFSAFVNTTAGSDKFLVYKPGAYSTNISAVGIITSSILTGAGTPAVRDGYSNDDDFAQVYGAIWMGQTFTASTTYIVEGITLLLYRELNPGTVTVSIRATSGGLATGTDLTSGTTDGNTLTTGTGGEWREIAVAPIVLSSGTQYAIVIRATTGDVSNTLRWRIDSSAPTYSGGTRITTADSGSTWALSSTIDCAFRVNAYYYTVSKAVSTSSLASGQYVIKTVEDGTNLKIYVNGSENGTTASAVSVPSNTSNWFWNFNNVMPYINSANITVGGNQKLWYQPTALISGTTLPNRASSGSYPGVITWGTNPSDVVIAISGITSSVATTPTTATSDTTVSYELPTSSKPTGWFVSGTFAGVLTPELLQTIESASVGLGLPDDGTGNHSRNLLIMLWFGLAIAIGLSVLLFTGSVLGTLLVVTVVLWAGVNAGVIDFGLVFLVIVLGFGGLYLVKQH